MEEYLTLLNDRQREAVVYTEGPELVIAGAGSGKTRVLTYKIVHLLNHGYEPWRIMALTFTNKASGWAPSTRCFCEYCAVILTV